MFFPLGQLLLLVPNYTFHQFVWFLINEAGFNRKMAIQLSCMTEIRSATGFLSATSNFQLGFEKLDMMLVEANRGMSWPLAWRVFMCTLATGHRNSPGWSNLWEDELPGIQRSYNDIVGKVQFSESALSQLPICSAGCVPPFRQGAKACPLCVCVSPAYPTALSHSSRCVTPALHCFSPRALSLIPCFLRRILRNSKWIQLDTELLVLLQC